MHYDYSDDSVVFRSGRVLSALSLWLAWLALLLVFTPQQSLAAQSADEAVPDKTVYLFWGEGCPHCESLKSFINQLQEDLPELRVESYEVWRQGRFHDLFISMATIHGIEPGSVPTLFFQGQVWVGDGPAIRQQIEQAVMRAYSSLPEISIPVPGIAEQPLIHLPLSDQVSTTPKAVEGRAIKLPVLGEVSATDSSLLLLTLLIAFVDGMNPCSIWVLALLLGLVIHSGSRRRILLVGVTFLLTTASIYGAFISGVFSVLSYVLYLSWVQWAVALLALVFGLVNIKDYFLFGKGISFTIPKSQKPGIYQKLRTLLRYELTGFSLLLATVVMASGIALVELPCTAGFPVVWSGILADRDVQGVDFLLLLALYLLIYLGVELSIFLVALVTLKMGRFEERQGRILKLLGGTIMVMLALVMAFSPELMNDLAGTLAVFVLAVLMALLIMAVHRFVTRSRL